MFRAQYANSTAAQHYANQAAAQTLAVQAPMTNPCLEGIVASVRSSLVGATISTETAAYMAAEVVKTIQRCMRPPGKNPHPRGNQPAKKQASGMCHMHPDSHNTISHTFANCTLNPANQKA